MEFIFAWVGFSIVVAVAARTRGRYAGGWFFLSLIFSPLLIGLLLLALPKGPTVKPALSVDPEPAFVPDGVMAGIPYRATEGGAVEAIMQGAKVRFPSVEAFTKAVDAKA